MPRPSTATLDPYDVPVTSPSARAGGRAGLDDPRRELQAPVRSGSRRRETQNAGPIVPGVSVTSRSLTFVISIMCFLACLTAGAVYMINQSADAWLRDVASEVTVQIEPREGVDVERTIAEVVSHLVGQPGISGAEPISLAASTALLEPWLGQSDALRSLPVPRLVAITLDRNAPPDFSRLAADVKERFPGATLDDHRQWQSQIQTVTRSLALGGIAILALVGVATVLIIISATQSAMASNREIVEVLHFVGATDGFIAREFEKHFLRLGIRAGILGASLAMLVFLLMPTATLLLGGGSMTMVELNRLIGTGTLDAAGYVLLGIVVVVISALCMLTSRYGVYGILQGGRD
ncbi:MAG: ABC transporter permease [Hyphomicrobiaceae bacterium]|nr:ABC transporter permease [Hyphomicrobiaceae bacterium]